MESTETTAEVGSLTTHQKPLAEMTDAHRRWIVRWEPQLAAIGAACKPDGSPADHVWASTPRGGGRFYLAVKLANRSYRLASLAADGTVKPIGKPISSPAGILEALKPYRVKAAAERAALKAKGAKK